MRFNELFIKITYLTQINNVKQTDIGKPIGLDTATINKRAKNNSKFSDAEIKLIEKYFNVDLNSVSISKNTFKIRNDISIQKKFSSFCSRLYDLQNKTGLSDFDFAQLIGFEQDEYLEFKSGDRKPNLKLLLLLKQHFEISLDWIIVGE